jgi:membrane-bound lytic murein transglycosylase
MQGVGGDPQLAAHQPVGPVGQPQQPQAFIAAIAADTRPSLWLQPELLAHERSAAADRALVHAQGSGRLDLCSGELQQIEHMQWLKRAWRGVAGALASP